MPARIKLAARESTTFGAVFTKHTNKKVSRSVRLGYDKQAWQGYLHARGDSAVN